MKVIYSDNAIPKYSLGEDYIFLAGPTPRRKDVASWRPEALDILKKLNFTGTVFIPEYSNTIIAEDDFNYIGQVEWEREALVRCGAIGAILFWVPRHIQDMPAFTTNVEFGYYLARYPKSIYYGRPDWAVKCDYLDWLYEKETSFKAYNNLEKMTEDILDWFLISR